ncbi:hypothetical protein Tco_0251734 [Tanacetum coccineum]
MSANDNFSLHDDEELSLHDDASLDGSLSRSGERKEASHQSKVVYQGSSFTTLFERFAEEKEGKLELTEVIVLIPLPLPRTKLLLPGLVMKFVHSFLATNADDVGFDNEDLDQMMIWECKFNGSKEGRQAGKQVEFHCLSTCNPMNSVGRLGAVLTMQSMVNVNTGHGNVSSAGTQIKSGGSRFNTGRQHVNFWGPPVEHGVGGGCGRMGTAVKTSAGCVWRKVIPLSNTNSGPTPESNVIVSRGGISGKGTLGLAISPSANHVEEVFSNADDDEMHEIRIYEIMVSLSYSMATKAPLAQEKEFVLVRRFRTLHNKKPGYHSRRCTFEIRSLHKGCFEKKLIKVLHSSWKGMLQAQLEMKKDCPVSFLIGCRFGLGFLPKLLKIDGYTEIVDVPQKPQIEYCLTPNLLYLRLLVKQFWQTDNCKKRRLQMGLNKINATIDSIEYTIT